MRVSTVDGSSDCCERPASSGFAQEGTKGPRLVEAPNGGSALRMGPTIGGTSSSTANYPLPHMSSPKSALSQVVARSPGDDRRLDDTSSTRTHREAALAGALPSRTLGTSGCAIEGLTFGTRFVKVAM
jgi:hypothetical protein